MPGSVGAFCNSRLGIVFLDDAFDTERIVTVGSPASAVPQYWHLAAGFADMFIAHAESKHLVKFIREHGAAQEIVGATAR